VYVIDSGVSKAMTETSGFIQAWTALSDHEDCSGHGTRVAGVIASATFGVAKAANVYALRVLDCAATGLTSDTLAALDYVASTVTAKTSAARSVVNLSVSMAYSASLNAAVQAVIDKGVIVVVASGNAGGNACDYSPASVPSAITVGAVDEIGAAASFSNQGSCVDMFAPGVAIQAPNLSHAPSGNSSSSGTSFAAPHVTGIVARLIAQLSPTAPTSPFSTVMTTADVLSTLSCEATSGIVMGTTTGNLLAHLAPAGAAVTKSGAACATSTCSGGCLFGTCRYVCWKGLSCVGVDDLALILLRLYRTETVGAPAAAIPLAPLVQQGLMSQR
jgi:subtilisin family serine protease